MKNSIKIKNTGKRLFKSAKKLFSEETNTDRSILPETYSGGQFVKEVFDASKERFKPRIDNEWIQFAREYGAEYEEIRQMPVVYYNYSGTKTIFKEVSSANHNYCAVIGASVSNPYGFRFSLEPRNFFSFVHRSWKGIEIIQTGNGEFDSRFVLACNKPDISKLIFTSKPVFTILKNPPFLILNHLELDFEETLQLSIQYFKPELFKWFSFFRLIIDIFHLVEDAKSIELESDIKQKTEEGCSFETLVETLKNESFEKRRDAIRALSQTRDVRATYPLVEALRDDQILIREEAAKALGTLGDRLAIAALVESLSDELSVRREAAIAIGRIGGMSAVGPLIETENLMRVTQSVNLPLPNKKIHMETRFAICNTLKSIIWANQEKIKHYPRLFCSKCLRRGVKIRVTKGIFKDVWLAVCPECNDANHLMTGAEQVVGFIGGSGEDILEKAGTLYVRLWFDREKLIRYADIDRLSIREGCVTHYEQAVNSLILELTADASRPASSTKRIPTCLEGNPCLSKATIQMLKAKFDFLDPL